MRRVPFRLTAALIGLSLLGLGIGFALDTFPHGWLTDHPTTANIIAGILAVPLTLLAALYLVDYFVERSAKQRSAPLRRAILDQIESRVGTIMLYSQSGLFGGIGPESTWQKRTTPPYWPQNLAWMRARFDTGDIPRNWNDLFVPLPPLPSGWSRFPQIPAVDDTAPRTNPNPGPLVKAADSTSTLLDLVEAYGELTDDAALAYWTHIMREPIARQTREVEAWVKAFKSEESWPGLATSHKLSYSNRGTSLPFSVLATCEALASLMMHLGLVPAKDWPKGAGEVPDFSLRKSRVAGIGGRV